MRVYGSGFASTPSQNTVRLGEVATHVQWATSSVLVFVVPEGASTGAITVAAGGSVTTSAESFTVVTDLAVVDFDPKIGKIGTPIEVTGYSFGASPSANAVMVGAGAAAVTGATVSTLLATVGEASSSGKVTVTVEGVTAGSEADFVLLPGDLEPVDVGFTARGDYGVQTTVAVEGPGKAGVVLFDGIQGQHVTLAVSENTYPGATAVTIYGPDGEEFYAGTFASGVGAKYAPTSALPDDGTYTIVIQPAFGALGSMDIMVFADATATLAIDGDGVDLSMAAGQNGRLTFEGQVGDLITMAWPASVNSSSIAARLYAPGGALFNQWSIYPGAGHFRPAALPAAGTYTLVLPPPGITAASLTLLGSRAVTGIIPADSTVVRADLARPGQQGRLTFEGVAGRGYTLRVTTGPTFTTTTRVVVSRPDGSSVGGSSSVASDTSAKIDLGPLPMTGTYTVTLMPGAADAGTIDLRLIPEHTATLVADGPSTPVALEPAQNGRYTFDGSAGEEIALGVTGLATVPAGAQLAWVIYKPDGTTFESASLSTAGSLRLAKLPAAGTYTVTVKPAGVAGASFNVLLSRTLTGVLTANGSSSVVTLGRAGQVARYTFEGVAGQRLTLLATAGPTFVGTVGIAVAQPSGASFQSSSVAKGSTSKMDLGLLPATGMYAVTLTPTGADTGSVDLRLTPYATETLVAGGGSKTISLAPGQNGQATFMASEGDYAALGVTAVTTTPAGQSVSIQALRPDGSAAGSAYNFGAPGALRLGPLPQTGSYTILLRTSGTIAASLTLVLSSPMTGTVPTDGTAVRFGPGVPGQIGRYVFEGVSGLGFTVQATAGATFASAVSVAVLQPSGASLKSGSAASGSSVKIDLGLLPVAGSYTIVVTPQALQTGTVDLRVVPEDVGPLVVDGPTRSVGLGTAQNGRYSFSGSAGDLRNVVVTGVSMTPGGGSLALAVLKPDGTSLATRTTAGATTWQLPQLTVAGAYTLTVKPSDTRAATLGLQVTAR